PALTLVLTFRPRATVWLWFAPSIPPDFAVEPMRISPVPPPAFTFVLIFILMVSFLEKLIAAMAAVLLVKTPNRAGYCYANIFQRTGLRLERSWRESRLLHCGQSKSQVHRPAFSFKRRNTFSIFALVVKC